MLRLSRKLKAMKKPSRDFSKQNFSDLEKRVVEAHKIVLSCQNLTLSNPNMVNATMELEAQTKWMILLRAEESFFCQRSRVLWLRDGDSNTNYFHRMANSRHSINHIQFLFDDHGLKIESQQGIRDLCVDYFSNLFGGEISSHMLIQSNMNLLLPFR